MAALLLLGLGPARAAGPADLPLPPTGVADAVGLLDADAEDALARAVAGVEGAHVVVVLAPFVAPETPESYADLMLATWFPDGDGVMFLLSKRERRLVARAGTAVEGLDARFLSVMAQEAMVPRLLDGDVAGALLAGVARVEERLDDHGPSPAWVTVGLGLLVATLVVGRELRA